jgi:hypothetical protein
MKGGFLPKSHQMHELYLIYFSDTSSTNGNPLSMKKTVFHDPIWSCLAQYEMRTRPGERRKEDYCEIEKWKVEGCVPSWMSWLGWLLFTIEASERRVEYQLTQGRVSRSGVPGDGGRGWCLWRGPIGNEYYRRSPVSLKKWGMTALNGIFLFWTKIISFRGRSQQQARAIGRGVVPTKENIGPVSQVRSFHR